MQFILRKFLSWSGMPYALRSRIVRDRVPFLLFYLLTLLLYFLTLANFTLHSILQHYTSGYQSHVSGLETAVPLEGLIVMCAMLAWIFTLRDDADFATVRRMFDGTCLHEVPVVAVEKSLSECVRDAEDCLSLLMFEGEGQRTHNAKMKRLNRTVAFLSSFVLAFIPFAVRLYYGYSFFGQYGDAVCSKYDAAFVVITVLAFCSTHLFGFFFTNILLFTYFHLYERRIWYIRLKSMLSMEEAKKQEVPFLSMEHSSNILAWQRLREYITHFKGTDLDRMQAILAAMLAFVATLVVLIFVQRFVGFRDRIDEGVVYVFTGWFLLCTCRLM